MLQNKYFLKIVFSIFSLFFLSNEEAYETQIVSVKNNDLKKFGEQGRWIGGLSDIYSKLCKK